MTLVCPVCNGLAAVEKKCPACGEDMRDAGVIQDFYDDYSAYLEQDIYEDGYRFYDDDTCVHLFACPRCHYDTCIKFERVSGENLLD